MPGEQQWSLTVRVEGLALWMLRDDCIDVLFPDDGLATSHDPSRHHFVTVHDAYAGAPDQGDGLDGVTLDFTGLRTVPPSEPVLYPSGTVPLVIEEGSIASRKDAVMTGKGLVAGLRLPLGYVVSLGSEKGPFRLGANHTMYLGYGASWTATMAEPQDLRAETKSYRENASGSTWTPTSNAEACNLEFTVKCLSGTDRQSTESLKYLEPLSEVAYLGYLSTAKRKLLAPVPVYHGSAKSCTPSQFKIVAYPQRPCPQGTGTSGGTA